MANIAVKRRTGDTGHNANTDEFKLPVYFTKMYTYYKLLHMIENEPGESASIKTGFGLAVGRSRPLDQNNTAY